MFVEVAMTDAGSCLDDWHCGILADILNESAATARNDQVDISVSMQHLRRCLMSGRQQRYTIGIYTVLLKYCFNNADDGLVGIVSIFTSLEHAGISTLQTK